VLNDIIRCTSWYQQQKKEKSERDEKGKEEDETCSGREGNRCRWLLVWWGSWCRMNKMRDMKLAEGSQLEGVYDDIIVSGSFGILIVLDVFHRIDNLVD